MKTIRINILFAIIILAFIKQSDVFALAPNNENNKFDCLVREAEGYFLTSCFLADDLEKEAKTQWQVFVSTTYVYHGTSGQFKANVLEKGLNYQHKPFTQEELQKILEIARKAGAVRLINSVGLEIQHDADKVFLRLHGYLQLIMPILNPRGLSKPPQGIKTRLKSCQNLLWIFESGRILV